ncbi:MAG TPA: hypothetical protein VH040_14025 [Usitatibacter sp.]|jgi:hypothetical protein|nr:hypothetical protein [Usitatibacter sp.]
MKAGATPATQFLAAHGVIYTEHEFDYLEHGGGHEELVRLLSPVLVEAAIEE